VTVTVVSNAPGLATISTDPLQAGSGGPITFTNVSTTGVGSIYVHGRGLGSTTLTVQAAGYNDGISVVNVHPSGFIINTGSFTTTTLAPNSNISVIPVRLHPTTLQWQSNQPVRGGLSVTVNLTNETPAVGVLTSSSLTFQPNVFSLFAPFDPLQGGSTDIGIGTPAGFTTPAAQTEITVTVIDPTISIGGDAIVGRDLQLQRSVTLQNTPPSARTVTVTVANPSIATVSSDPAAAGSQTVVFDGVTTTFAGNIYIQGRALGTTTITATAADYTTDVIDVEVRQSGFIILSPASISTTTTAANTGIQIIGAVLDPLTLNWQFNQALRGGPNVNVTVTSSNPAAGTITVSPVVFTPNTFSVFTAFDPTAPGGVSTITVGTPAGFDTPSGQREITATVNPP
jgi:hypothetical protein